jgi:hypothetical protein
VTPFQVAQMMVLIGGVGIAVDAAEMLASRTAYSPAGIFSFELLQSGRRFLVSGLLAQPLRWLLEYPRMLALPVAQLGAVLAMTAVVFGEPAGQRALLASLAALVLLSRLMLHGRNVFGHDGSDQMLIVVFLSALVTFALGDTRAAYAGIAYAAGQLVLSYWVSGVAKAISRVWRSGDAIAAIFGTQGYGYPALGAFLRRHRLLSRSSCWAVIGFECLSPFLLLAGTKGAMVFIALGLGFHLSVAIFMGLNVFVWSFAACYPAIFVLTERFHP